MLINSIIPQESTIYNISCRIFFYYNCFSAHCKSHNSHSIGICYIGGLDADGKTPKDTRTEAQKATLRKLIEQLHQRYPKALIVGHHDLNPQKTCPCFNVTAEYIDLQP